MSHARASDRSVGSLLGVVAVAAGLLPWVRGGEPLPIPVGVGVVLLLLALVAPKALAPLAWAWDRLGRALQRVVGPVVLALVFFLVVTPTGLLRRAFGHDDLGLRRGAPPRWEPREAPASMRHPY